jgi:hypothetical protein
MLARPLICRHKTFTTSGANLNPVLDKVDEFVSAIGPYNLIGLVAGPEPYELTVYFWVDPALSGGAL